MTTDITELAQSLKAAANKAGADDWQAKKISGEFYVIRKGSYSSKCGYRTYQPIAEIDHKSTRDYVAIASPANILALVEALEKAQTINAAAEKLVRCKGRYHSEQNYRALAALFGVNTPDLPPLEHENVHYADAAEMEIAALRQRIADLESRTVTVKLPEPFKLAKSSSGLRYYYADEVDAALTASGIKVEAE
ncbi:ead/Ea22-like family protein [Klebsiella pneumoniae]|nr:ead/Ea22-like family protein [Klebsiella pneumoniae]